VPPCEKILRLKISHGAAETSNHRFARRRGRKKAAVDTGQAGVLECVIDNILVENKEFL
jgi:hypothetical protein